MAILAGCAALSCGPRELPPLGEVVVVVDTDLPVPRVASGLRVDTYGATDGVWLDSRDVARRDPRDWPASFSVQAIDDTRERDVLIRLRVHGERTRDVVSGPRLVVDGRDVTPPTEPVPALTVDRLLLVRLRPGERGRLAVVMRASCAGTPARLDAGARESCVGGEGVREPVALATLEPDLATPGASLAGSAARAACPGSATSEARVCVEGGAFVMGADDIQVAPDPTVPSLPQLVARISTFAIDRDEVTVGRFRAAMAGGFVPPDPPGFTDGELSATAAATCSYSATPRGREDFAMSCVTWATSRALCNYMGGDLPTEAQWEYVATSAARRGASIFPWGDEPPDCARAVYGRLSLAGQPGGCESAAGSGPRPVRTATGPFAAGDVSAVGVRGLGGGLAEWTRDAAGPYEAACRRGLDPTCEAPANEEHVARGGAWASTAINLRSTSRVASRNASAVTGFRCVAPR